MIPAPISDLHPREYQHPLDEQAYEAMHAIPGFDSVSRLFMKHGIERLFKIQYTGSNLEITKSNYPNLIEILEDVCRTLGITKIPLLYVEWNDAINAHTIGSDNPIIMLSSGSVDRLTEPELRFVIGHECGHIKGSHSQYRAMALSVTSLGEFIGDWTLGVGKLASQPLQLALTRWSRFSELSCDRAGLLSCQDKHAAISVMVKISGLPKKFNDSVFHDTFIQQATRFEEIDFDTASKLVKFAAGIGRTHPWTVLRAAEIIKWIETGYYDAVLSRRTTKMVQVRTIEGVEFCRHCNYRLKGSEGFCPGCGVKLQEFESGRSGA